MRSELESRVIEEANYILSGNATVRKTAAEFGIGKSTVHHDLTARLKEIDGDLSEKVKRLLFINISERHIRGGVATREKFLSGK